MTMPHSLTRTGLSGQVAEAVLDVADRSLDTSLSTAVSDRLLHGIGVALTGTEFEAFAAGLRAVSSESGASTVLGRGNRLSPAAAAFVNAIAAHSCLQEDCGPGGYVEGSHPGTYIIPAALAAVDAAGISGERFARGVIAGYEAVSILGEIVPGGLSARKYRPSGIMGPFGAAAAAAYIFGADANQLATALSIASNSAAGSNQGFVSGTIEPLAHAGLGARNGLLAAKLAMAGAAASPNALEGPYGFFAVYAGEQPTVAGLGLRSEEPAITRLGSKKFAVCLQNQETLELAGELAPALSGATIRELVLSRPNTPANGTGSAGVGAEGPFETMLQRQMSARFTLAAALLGRPVTDPRYFNEAGADARAADLAVLVSLRQNEADAVEIVARLDDGRELRIAGRRPEILQPSSGRIDELFLERAGKVLNAELAERVLCDIRSISSVPDAAVITNALRG